MRTRRVRATTEIARGTERRTPPISLSTHLKQATFKISSIMAKSKKSSAESSKGEGGKGRGKGAQEDGWGGLFHHIYLHPSGRS